MLRPGGRLVGYDQLSTPPLRRLHPDSDPRHRMIRLSELRDAPDGLPVDKTVLTPSLAGFAVRLSFQKAGGS